MAVQLCSNCHQPEPSGRSLEKGRCRTCAGYHRRTGHERPPTAWRKLTHLSDDDLTVLLTWCDQKLNVARTNSSEGEPNADYYQAEWERLTALRVKLNAMLGVGK